MNESNDKIIKLAQLDILNELKRICDANKIEYFLNAGSLLGAIRHNGFIPWDDDIDVGMKREDFNTFIECCKTQLGEEYYLHDWNNDENSPHPFAKLKIKNTHYREDIASDSLMDDGIFIDIFPYDNVPKSRVLQVIQKIKIIILRKELLLKNKIKIIGNSPSSKLLYFPIQVMTVFSNKKSIKKKLYKEMIKYNTKESNFLTTHGGSYPYEREMIEYQWIKNKKKHLFEKYEYDIPSEYDAFLKHLYGDYMKLPPEEKRKGKHKIIKIDLGDYKIKSNS